MLPQLFNALEETLFMMFAAGLLTVLLGLPLGLLIAISRPRSLFPAPLLHKSLKAVMTIAGSIPYLVIMIAVIPLTRHLFGTEQGSAAAIVPLTLAALPYFTNFSTQAFQSVPKSLIEMGINFGGSPFQILRKILLPESLPYLFHGFLRTLSHLLGFTVIAGALGAGGLGELAIEKGYHQFNLNYILGITLIMILMFQAIQFFGKFIRIDEKALR